MFIVLNLYFFLSLVLVISCCFVIFSNSSIYSLLWLVITFLISSIFLLVLGCEFLALIFLIVYVGAIAILFLFVVMLLDLKFKNFYNKKNYSFISLIFVGNILLLFLLFLCFNSTINKYFFLKLKSIIFYFLFNVEKINYFINWVEYVNSINEINIYSLVFYDVFIIQLLIVGVILLAVLIGIVYLTNFYKNYEILDQSVLKQISVNSSFFLK